MFLQGTHVLTGQSLKCLHTKVHLGATCFREGLGSEEPFMNYTNFNISFQRFAYQQSVTPEILLSVY